uniref:Uncharacterized protein n=1 Tax=Setaria viridis TaxID=4556 RepID=A0A4U6VKN1_SETVI|nr:hypothetical protein SEVIR_3G390150v2 [Setaria viridis]
METCFDAEVLKLTLITGAVSNLQPPCAPVVFLLLLVSAAAAVVFFSKHL